MLSLKARQGVFRPRRALIALSASVSLGAPGARFGRHSSTADQRRSFSRCRIHTWDSPLDLEYHQFHRKRHQRNRAALQDALRREAQWKKPSFFAKLFGSRHASHWSKSPKRWPQMIEEELRRSTPIPVDDRVELSVREKRWKKQMDSMRDYVNSDPYKAVFGRPFDPFWSPAVWSPLMPSWLKPHLEQSAFVEDTSDKTSTPIAEQVKSASKSAVSASNASTRPSSIPHDLSMQSSDIRSRTSSFVHTVRQETGQPLTVNASSSNWDSVSDTTRVFDYDPISNRMVSRTRKPQDQLHNKVQKAPNSDSAIKSTTPVGPCVLVAESSYQSVADPGAQSESTKSGTPPTSTQAKLSILPKDDVDFMTAETVRASVRNRRRRVFAADPAIGRTDNSELSKSFEDRTKLNTAEIEEARNALAQNKNKVAMKQPGPDVKFAPSESFIQPALDRVNQRKSVQEDQRQIPRRIRDALAVLDMPSKVSDFEPKPVTTDKPHEYAVITALPDIPETLVVDGYSTEPIGLQTSYRSEQQAVSAKRQLPLADEIVANTDTSTVTPDGYTQASVGMQTTFTQECNDTSAKVRPSLAQEIEQNTTAEDMHHDFTDHSASNGDSTNKVPNLPISQGISTESGNQDLQTSSNTTPSPRLQTSKAFQDHKTKTPRGLDILYGYEHTEELHTKITPDFAAQKQRQIAQKAALDEEIEAQKLAMRRYDARHAYSSDPATSMFKSAVGAKAPITKIVQAEGDVSADVGRYAHRKAATQVVKTVQAEGDICANVGQYTDSNRWYKQTNEAREAVRNVASQDSATAPPVSTTTVKVGAAKQDDLTLNIRKICEEHGLFEPLSVQKKLNELEQRLAALQQREQTAIRDLDRRLETLSTSSEAQLGPATSNDELIVPWAEPPSYKILTWDPFAWGENIKIATTTARFAAIEHPISIKQALSLVRKPERFISYFADFQTEGYQVIHAAEDLLVLRKTAMTGASASAKSVPAATGTTIQVEQPTPTMTDPTGTPAKSAINPIDGTGRPPTQTATGNFASPTGFVNHDPIFPLSLPSSSIFPVATSKTLPAPPQIPSPDASPAAEQNSPRIRRQEQVFSGSARQAREEERRGRKQHARRKWKRRVRFVGSVLATSIVGVYAIGVGAELARGEKRTVV